MSNRYLQEATALIRDQQGPRGPIWMCGEQLLEMITPDEAATKLVLDDLQHGGLTLAACEQKIAGFAKKNKGCCTGTEAEKIIRGYFGLGTTPKAQKQETETAAPAGDTIRLEDFFG